MLFDKSLIEGALPQRSGQVAHYTKIGSLCHFVPRAGSLSSVGTWSSAWSTPVQFLNDRLELSLGLDVLQRVAERSPKSGLRVRNLIEGLRSNFGTLETDAFQMSFSGNPDELGQWRGYGADGMGCSVVTNSDDVRNVADVAGWVLYDPRKQVAFAAKILERLRKETDDALILKYLVATASYMKHPGFAPEEEYRLIVFPGSASIEFREAGDRLVPYFDYLKGKNSLPVERVIIGPGWQLSRLAKTEALKHHVFQAIQRLLTARGLHLTQIESSLIPYDPK